VSFVVPSVSALDDGINPHVKLSEVGDVLLDAGAGLGVGVEVGDLAEEVGTETLMGVVKNAVLVLVVSGGGVLGEELNLPDEVSLGTLGGGGLL